MSSAQKLRAVALEHAARGWAVFPLQANTKRPALHGEDKCPATNACAEGHVGWEARATTDPERIERTWTMGRNNPAHWNIGIATGPSGLLVVDTDAPKAGELAPPPWKESSAKHGEDSLTEWQSYYGQLPETYTVATRHGWHRYFQQPELDDEDPQLRNSVDKLGWLVDTRGTGGYVVGAGSVVDGHEYRTTTPGPVAELPAAMTEQLTDPVPDKSGQELVLPVDPDRREAYVRRAVQNELGRVLSSGPHQHNNSLHQASANLGRLAAETGMDVTVLRGALQAAGEQVGQGSREAFGTIASGLRAGGIEVPRSTAVPHQFRTQPPAHQPPPASPREQEASPAAATAPEAAAPETAAAAAVDTPEAAAAAEPVPSPATPAPGRGASVMVSGTRDRAHRARAAHTTPAAAGVTADAATTTTQPAGEERTLQ